MTRAALAILLLAAWLSPGAEAAAADWTVDRAHSTIGFSATETGHRFSGRFARYDAAIAFDPAHPDQAHVAVTIDPASATTGDPQRDAALPGHDWFDVAAFPRAVFRSTAIRRAGSDAYVADGTLSLRGVTRPVSLPFTLDISGGVAHASAALDLTRTVFGVGQGPWASGQWVGLTVGVRIAIEARAAS